MTLTTREFLKEATWTTEIIDRWLDPDARNWCAYEPELGYRLKDCIDQDGLDGSYTISHYNPPGERRMINFADKPCRINSYGDSFTQCIQVSDGESWQEYLAAHFGEPIRNWGVGSMGFYQVYRRMLREERTSLSAPNIILNVFSDDHYRSIYSLRWLHLTVDVFRQQKVVPTEGLWDFGNPPWPHLRLDLDTGGFEEHNNPYPTPDSLYQLADEDHIYETYRDNPTLQAHLAEQGVIDFDTSILQRMADALEVSTDFSSPEASASTGHALLQTCALWSSEYILDKVKEFTQTEGKKLLVLLTHPWREVVAMCNGLPRFDQPFVDYLENNDFMYVDGLRLHQRDFSTFSGAPEAYVDQYYKFVRRGHYNPRGNHFFAFAIKDSIVGWLDPKPPTYLQEGEPSL